MKAAKRPDANRLSDALAMRMVASAHGAA